MVATWLVNGRGFGSKPLSPPQKKIVLSQTYTDHLTEVKLLAGLVSSV